MRQFEEALRADDATYLDTEAPNSPLVGPQHFTSPPASHRVRKVSALSDFAPVNLKVKKYVTIPLTQLLIDATGAGASVMRGPHTRVASGSISFSDGHC